MTTASTRFWSKVQRLGSDECWLWLACVDGGGYGVLANPTGDRLAHRFAYVELVGPVPDGLVLDHLCRNRRCVNPAHLEAVTNRENILRGASRSAANAAKTHCIRNHELAGDNLYTRGAARACRTCKAAVEKERVARKKAAA